MDTSYTKNFGGVELKEAVLVLLENESALSRLRKVLGSKLASKIASLKTEPASHGDLWDQVCDYFMDEIENESKSVWEGLTFDPNDEDNPDTTYPVSVDEYEGVFSVCALEYDRAGYFLTKTDAEEYVRCTFENVRQA